MAGVGVTWYQVLGGGGDGICGIKVTGLEPHRYILLPSLLPHPAPSNAAVAMASLAHSPIGPVDL